MAVIVFVFVFIFLKKMRTVCSFWSLCSVCFGSKLNFDTLEGVLGECQYFEIT